MFWEGKRKSLESEDSRLWQRVKDSNPHIQSQSLLCYHYTNPLFVFCCCLPQQQILLYKKIKKCQQFILKNFDFFEGGLIGCVRNLKCLFLENFRDKK